MVVPFWGQLYGKLRRAGSGLPAALTRYGCCWLGVLLLLLNLLVGVTREEAV